MVSKDKLIVAQVAFKGAIDLVVNDKIQLSDVQDTVAGFVDMMMTYQDKSAIDSYDTPNKPVYQPKKNYGGNTGKVGNPKADASDKQIAYIKSLVSELPVSDQKPYLELLNSKINKGVAHSTIEQLKAKIDDNTPQARTDTTPDEAPF